MLLHNHVPTHYTYTHTYIIKIKSKIYCKIKYIYDQICHCGFFIPFCELFVIIRFILNSRWFRIYRFHQYRFKNRSANFAARMANREYLAPAVSIRSISIESQGQISKNASVLRSTSFYTSVCQRQGWWNVLVRAISGNSNYLMCVSRETQCETVRHLMRIKNPCVIMQQRMLTRQLRLRFVVESSLNE